MAHCKCIIFLLISKSMNKPSFFNEVLTHTIPYFSTICGKKQPQFCFICLVWIFHYSSRKVLSKYFSRRKKLHVSLTYSHYIFTTASSHSQFEMTTTFLSTTAFFFCLLCLLFLPWMEYRFSLRCLTASIWETREIKILLLIFYLSFSM